jgi:DNA-binding NarL/FixJ family response regulator
VSASPYAGHLRVLLVDDHRIFAEVLAIRLRSEPEVEHAQVAFSLTEARIALRDLRPHLVLLDAQLGQVSGLALLEDIVVLQGRPRVLVLSGHSDAPTLVRALRAGADGWITKGVAFDVLKAAVQRALIGEMYLPPAAVRPVIEQLLAESRVPRTDGTFLNQLTDRQLEVLRCLVAGMSRREIAARLYVTVNTVHSHVQHMLHLADEHSTPALVARARALGVRGPAQTAAATATDA